MNMTIKQTSNPLYIRVRTQLILEYLKIKGARGSKKNKRSKRRDIQEKELIYQRRERDTRESFNTKKRKRLVSKLLIQTTITATIILSITGIKAYAFHDLDTTPAESPFNSPVSQSPLISDEEQAILEQVVYHEARGSNEADMMAVAQTVLNRVNHPDFPDTVYSVVTQPKQYNPYYTYSNMPISEEIQEAVQRVVDGETILDPDVVYYWTPECASISSWFQSMEANNFYANIGGHNYYYGSESSSI